MRVTMGVAWSKRARLTNAPKMILQECNMSWFETIPTSNPGDECASIVKSSPLILNEEAGIHRYSIDFPVPRTYIMHLHHGVTNIGHRDEVRFSPSVISEDHWVMVCNSNLMFHRSTRNDICRIGI